VPVAVVVAHEVAVQNVPAVTHVFVDAVDVKIVLPTVMFAVIDAEPAALASTSTVGFVNELALIVVVHVAELPVVMDVELIVPAESPVQLVMYTVVLPVLVTVRTTVAVLVGAIWLPLWSTMLAVKVSSPKLLSFVPGVVSELAALVADDGLSFALVAAAAAQVLAPPVSCASPVLGTVFPSWS